MSPTRRREAVGHVQQELGISERRACKALGQPRSTQRYQQKVKDDEPELIATMHELVAEHPRYGCRRIRVLLLERGFRLGHVRMWRLWKREGFKVPQKQRKKRRLGTSKNGITRRKAEGVNDVWAWAGVEGLAATTAMSVGGR